MSCFQPSMLNGQGEGVVTSCPSTVYYTFLNDTPIFLRILANLSSEDYNASSGQLALVNESIDLQSTDSLLTSTELASDSAGSHMIVQPDHAIGQTLTDSKLDIDENELSLVPESINVVTLDRKRQKGKGGWPKGKKRKKEPVVAHPRAPATGYTLFAIERRQEIKDLHPHLAFRDVTKILGNEWSSLSNEDKQKYVTEAEADKKRYIEELEVYQKSPQYQEFLKRKKSKAIADHKSTDDPNEHLDSGCSVYEEDGLHCRLCNLYFSSNHNKKEHMLGKQHLTNMTSAFEKEHQKAVESTSSETDVHSDASQDVTPCPRDLQRSSVGVDPSAFIVDFMQRNQDRETEIKALSNTVKSSTEKNLELQMQLNKLEERYQTLTNEITASKTLSASLSAQSDSLKMVPALFGVYPSSKAPA